MEIDRKTPWNVILFQVLQTLLSEAFGPEVAESETAPTEANSLSRTLGLHQIEEPSYVIGENAAQMERIMASRRYEKKSRERARKILYMKKRALMRQEMRKREMRRRMFHILG